jgi:hypothetical protein
MKYTLVITALILATVVFTRPVSAADQKITSGIYLTADDFANGKITSEGFDNSASHKIELHDSIFGKPYIHVTHGTDKQEYPKNEIYGFRLGDGRSFRFVGNGEYEIREAGALYIYRTERLVRKGATEPAYYFSVDAAGDVLPLTLLNLKNAFPENHRFHDALDETFRSDSDLTWFDDFHKMYKVNRVLVATQTDR